jgi:hypothetical protein
MQFVKRGKGKVSQFFRSRRSMGAGLSHKTLRLAESQPIAMVRAWGRQVAAVQAPGSCAYALTLWTEAEIKKMIAGIPGLNIFDWELKPNEHPETTALFARLIHFSPSQRALALELLNRQKLVTPDPAEDVRLALYDHAAWLRRFDELMREGDEAGALSRALGPTVANMPEDLRHILLEKVRANYFSAVKLTADDIARNREDRPNPPKRALDVLVHGLIPPRAVIKGNDQVVSGKVAFERYGQWLGKINSALEINSYAETQVYVVLNDVRNYLNDMIALG